MRASPVNSHFFKLSVEIMICLNYLSLIYIVTYIHAQNNIHLFVYLVAIYTGTTGYQVFTIAPADQIPVDSGYYIGWWVYVAALVVGLED